MGIMDGILLTLIALLLVATLGILYLNLKSKPKDENKENEEIANLNVEIVKLKDSLNTTINTSLSSMSTSFNSLSTGVTKDMTAALTKVDEKVGNFNQQVELLNKSQEGITKILAGVKKYGTLAEFSLDALIKDLLPASQFMTNVKMKEDTSENVEFAIRLQGDVLVPVDSHFHLEKFKAITDAYDADDKKAVADARTKLATAFKAKAKSVNEKYIVPPKTTDFAIVYAPTESLYKELTEYQDATTKELLTQELMKKYKIVICGPNTLSAYLQSLHMGFQSLKVQKGATEIYDHLKTISTRFSKHFDNILILRKKLEEAMGVVDTFGKDARSITRTLENIKDPEQIEKAVQTENVEKFVDHSKQAKN
jgi:DNA recombination protein RmuC